MFHFSFGYHLHYIAYLWHGQLAMDALQKLLGANGAAIRGLNTPVNMPQGPRFLLRVDVDHFHPDPAILEQIEAMETEPIATFFREQRQEKDLEVELRKVKCLAWLARTVGEPVAAWFHEGDNGPLDEYAFGFRQTARVLYDAWQAACRDASDAPQSAYTAALWFLGADAPNRSESQWIHGGPAPWFPYWGNAAESAGD